MATDQSIPAVPSMKQPFATYLSTFGWMRILSCLILISILLFSSCKKEPTTWNSEFAAPVAYTTLDIGDILGDTNIVVNPDSTVNLLIEREIYRLVIDSLFKTPDTTISDVYMITSPIALTVSPGFTFLSEPEETTYDIEGAELKYFMLRSGRLNYEVISYVDGPTIDSIIMPSATKFGATFAERLEIPASDGITPVVISGSVDLSDYEFDLTGSDGLKYNTLLSKISATLDPAYTGGTVNISQADSIRMNVTFEDIIPQRALGYFGDELIDVPLDTFAIPFMNHILGGTVDLDQVSLDLTITDGLGVDKQAVISQINSISNSGSVGLTHSSIGSSINLTRPNRIGWVVEPEIRTESYTSASSNLEAFLENLPHEISYNLQFQINPFGDVNSHGDFFNYDFPLKADMKLEMPLCFAASNLTLQDTIVIDITQDTTNAQSGSVTINAVNSFPFGANIQLFLQDGSGAFTDSVMTSTTLSPAVVNTANEVVFASNSQLIMELNKEQIQTLMQSGQVLIRVIFDTTNPPGLVKIKDWYTIDLNMSANVEYQFNVN